MAKFVHIWLYFSKCILHQASEKHRNTFEKSSNLAKTKLEKSLFSLAFEAHFFADYPAIQFLDTWSITNHQHKKENPVAYLSHHQFLQKPTAPKFFVLIFTLSAAPLHLKKSQHNHFLVRLKCKPVYHKGCFINVFFFNSFF